MAGFHSSHSAAPVARIPSPFQVAVATLKRFLDTHTKRRERSEVAKLLTMDDRILHDMGVTRDDVHAALATSDHPSCSLQVVATRRRNKMVI